MCLVDDRVFPDNRYFPEYEYIGISGYHYAPSYRNGGWYLTADTMRYTLAQIVHLCSIPPDEAIMLALKYGS
jgi:hypothetical protein